MRRTICYYGLLTDCTNATTDVQCRQCAERLIGGVIETLRPAVINSDDHVNRGIAYQDDAIRKHASRLAEAVAKRLSEQLDQSWHEPALLIE